MEFLNAQELKKLTLEEAEKYAEFLRGYLIEKVSLSGGHLASNLGVVEISLALIRLFRSPHDKIIYDVGHQSYVHKLLTDRIFNENDLRKFGGYSGFTKRDESEHDPFGAGHSSTALSSALGFARASKLKGDDYYTIAVVGDGAFCSGMTFEAINNLSKDDKLIIILNDNEMSISENVGSMSLYFNKIRTTKPYLSLKRKTKKAISKIPVLSKALLWIASYIKDIIKRLFVRETLFESLGIEYLGPADGNDLETVETLLREAKTKEGPVLIHLITTKGKGMKKAELDPKGYHFVSPDKSAPASFSDEFSRLLIEYSEKNENTVAITAAMAEGTKLSAYRERFPNRFFDVGISEEHATTFAAALSAEGILPFFAVYSTFFQRSFDQVIHDVSLQKLKVVIALDRAGLVGADGPTHHGLFDVSMMLSVPGSTVYSPSNFKELKYAFDKCTASPEVSAVRYPRANDSELLTKVFDSTLDWSFDSERPSKVLFVTYGIIAEETLRAKLLLMKNDVSSSVMKFNLLKPLDFKKVQEDIEKISPDLIVVVEEGIKTGGFGEHLVANIKTSARCEILAIDEKFIPHGKRDELLRFAELDAQKITNRILEWIE